MIVGIGNVEMALGIELEPGGRYEETQRAEEQQLRAGAHREDDAQRGGSRRPFGGAAVASRTRLPVG